MAPTPSPFEANARRFRGSLDSYDRYRPAPPAILFELLQRFARLGRPALVVDLGCGTGLSTRYWAGRASRAIGVEPSPEMLAVARTVNDAPNVSFQPGFSHATGLDAGCADIITCCQSIHWMDPEPTIQEFARLLRPGGVLAVVSYDFPPLIDWELDLALSTCARRARETNEGMGLVKEQKRWSSGHAAQLEASGRFQHVREVALQSEEMGDADRLLGLVRTLSDVMMPLQHGVSEAALGLDELDRTARRILGERTVPWLWSYAVILAVR